MLYLYGFAAGDFLYAANKSQTSLIKVLRLLQAIQIVSEVINSGLDFRHNLWS
jgi:hypothetical protein